MTQHRYQQGEGGTLTHKHDTRSRVLKGYSHTRKAYDQRRRRNTLTRADKQYKTILKADPCSFCGPQPRHPQIAVDHIDALDYGGQDNWTNYTAACRACNASKKNTPLLHYLAGNRT